MMDKIKLFFVNILTRFLGFTIKIKGNTIEFICKTKQGEKNLKKCLLKMIMKM